MNDITVTTQNASTIVPAENYKEIAIEWLTSTGNLQKFTENEKTQFIDICCAYGLNPIKKEIYGIKYGNNFNMIVGYESYIKRAERSNKLDGWNCEIVGSGSDMKAVITIHRTDWKNPFKHEVYFEEYNTNQNLWKSKPRTMLKKVAIAQGFRMCFSEEIGGIPYTKEELPEDMTREEPVINSVEIAPPPAPSKSANIPEKKFTNEQAQKLAPIMNAVFDKTNEPVFTDAEKEQIRAMLINGEFEKAYKLANEELIARTADAEEFPEDVPF